MSGQRHFLGESPLERRTRRRETLIQTALNQVSAEGLQNVSVRSICTGAGLTSRYFYESFANLDELLQAAMGELAEQMLTAGAGAMSDLTASWRDRVHAGIGASVGVLLEDPRKAALMASLGAGDSALQRKRRDIVVRVAQQIQSDPEASVALKDTVSTLPLFIAGGLVETTLAFLDGGLPIPREQLVDELTDYVIGVVSAQQSVARRTSPTLRK